MNKLNKRLIFIILPIFFSKIVLAVSAEEFLKAASCNNLAIIKEYVESGNDINVADIGNDTALIRAAQAKNHNIVDYLLSKNPLITTTNFTKAAYLGNLAIIRRYTEEGKNINVIDVNGETALMNAVFLRHREIIDYLLDNGANVNIQNHYGNAAIHFAISGGSLEVVAVLLDRPGINKDVQDKNGFAPLHDAITRNKIKIARLLLLKGAQDNIKSKSGKTALDFARLMKYQDLINLIYVFSSLKILVIDYIKQNKEKFNPKEFDKLPEELKNLVL